MTEQAADTVIGMSDADLAVHPTVYAPGSFQGKTVLISGAAGGLGRAAAWLLGRLGARLILVGRKQDRLDSLATALAEKEIVAETIALDIRQQGDVQDLFRHVREKFGQLDLLINSAGGQFPQAAIDFSEKGWNAVIATNLTGTWFMMQAAAQFWRDTESKGSIVNIVVVTRHGLYGVAHTIAARAGVIGLSQNLAVEWAPLDIRVNCIAPGAIETEGWKVYSPEARALYHRSNPMMRNGSPWEIAEACAYLGGSSGSYITGEVLHVAGGGQHWGETWTIGKPDYFKE
ncbi:MAG: short-chain dehydrogenase [Rhodospirillaceae bacterium]|jgi:citronellol/citronellal dehydrogenase|uniref:SDR family oxidoreductase n=1 Tax=unclassified Hwanghaeella TaxID=2605944 RepID=UPI000C45A0D4|nr:short-chain dehydrogenase [Rhodospirillales bacterium]MAX49065.1 short-chain dehydrogenase [Rhodospirillaceae bacterium]|tara:strand:+ start:805 stop:1668 length:864 start_codon:yes stop_codon:yes gene_type:complete